MIDSTSPSSRASGAQSLPPETPPPTFRRPGHDRDTLSTDNADRVRAALASDPEVRPDAVARGRALAADPSYPPAAVIRQVAGQILNAPDLSEDQS
jgi:hypothetical protein